MGLAARFDQSAAAWPDRPFVITNNGTYSYRDMQEWSRGLARGLYNLGVRPGQRVAMVIDNRPEFVAVKIAIARLGATAVPINFQYRAEELAAVLGTAEATVLISIAASVGVDHLALLDDLIPGWEFGTLTDRLPYLQQVLVVTAGGRPGVRDLADVAAQAHRVDEGVVRRLEQSVSADAACDVVFTSGTSGRALGAVLTHDMVLRSAYGSAYHRAFDDGWRSCFSLPMYHVFGYIEGLLASMMVGGAVLPLPVFNPRTVLAAIQDHGVSELLLVPTMSVAVVEEAARRRYDLSSLESVMSAAAAAPVSLWRRIDEVLHPRLIFTGYGQTEVSAATTLTLPGDPMSIVSETVGREKLGGLAAASEPGGVLARYRAIDPHDGTVLASGGEGELSVRGPIVTHEYFNDPERTSTSIDAQGWLRTGDLGRIREDGYLELTGRSSELFKVGGELVAPKQVEQTLTSHPGVAQAYVAGVPDERFGQVGWAWVVPAAGVRVTDRELLQHCRTNLAGFKIPRKIKFLSDDELPKTSTGKIQKFRLIESLET